jgi:hypothetical protein
MASVVIIEGVGGILSHYSVRSDFAGFAAGEQLHCTQPDTGEFTWRNPD